MLLDIKPGEETDSASSAPGAHSSGLFLMVMQVGGKAAEHSHADTMVVPLRAIAHLLGPSGNNIKTVREISGAKVSHP